MISWRDKEGINEYEAKHQTYAGLKCRQEARGYKIGWIAWKFKEIFGRWPNGEAAESAQPADASMLYWIRKEAAKYRKRQKEEELRLAGVRGGFSGGVYNSNVDVESSGLMTEEDWGVKL